MPKGAQIVDDAAGGLRMPPGTRIDRLEWVGWGSERSLADVRGTRIDAEGVAWDHTLRRTSLTPDTALVGYEWPALDTVAHRNATKALVARLRRLPPAAGMKESGRSKYLAGIAKKNECLTCHQPGRPVATRRGEYGIVARGSDATRFFTPLNVLSDESVLEVYGLHDPNRGRESVTVSCPEATRTKGEGDKQRVLCKGSTYPTASYDPERAKGSEGERHERVCAGRRYLLDHMNEALRARYRGLLEGCA
jgi:hypothetical protein